MFCNHCGKKMADDNAFCASCGAPQKQSPMLVKPIYKKWWFWTLIGVAVISIIIVMITTINKNAMKGRAAFNFTGPMVGGESIVLVRLTDEGRDIWNKHTIKEQIIMSENEIFYIAENVVLDAYKAGYETQRYIVSPYCFLYDRERHILEIYWNAKTYQYDKGNWSEVFGEKPMDCNEEELESLFCQLMGCNKEELFNLYMMEMMELKDLENS